jgi:prepilin-type N-terminal cleavage/methylation domain-containing protein
MKCCSEKKPLSALSVHKGFSLPEVVAALIILGLVSSGVLVVINRCMVSATNSMQRMRAFEVARENMETLLSSDSVKEMVEYGSSDKYPGVEWTTVVETFYEPLTARMWIQAVCSAEYTDTENELQTVELTNWLTNVSEADVRRILEQQQEDELLAEEIIETEEEAADYAGVDQQTLQQWVENGMLKTDDGFYIKNQLDLYADNDGNPSVEDRQWQAKADASLLDPKKRRAMQSKQDTRSKQDVRSGPDLQGRPKDSPVEKRIGGRTYPELIDMGFPPELLKGLFNR